MMVSIILNFYYNYSEIIHFVYKYGKHDTLTKRSLNFKPFRHYTSDSDVYRRQNLTYKDDTHTERVKYL